MTIGSILLLAAAIGSGVIAVESREPRFFDHVPRARPWSGGWTAPALSEKQKRAAFVPYARAASDCLAGAVARNPRFAEAAREGTVTALAAEAVPFCVEPLLAMEEAHDRYYGPGTGHAFLTGPYVEGLGAALESRLGRRIAALRAAGGPPGGPAAILDATAVDRYLVLASREDLDAAILVAQDLLPTFPRLFVSRAANGRFAIVLGPIPTRFAGEMRDAWKREGKIPPDSFIADGTRLSGPIWDATSPRRPAIASVPPAAAPAAAPVPATPATPTPATPTPAAPPAPAAAEHGTYTGSGFFIAEDGSLLTNAHVAGDCRSLSVRGYGPALLIRKDAANDLALIRLNAGTPKAVARLRGEPVRPGASALVLGYPLSDLLGSAINVTAGMVSSLSGLDGDTRYFQFTAPLQPGNSGGPVLDSTGRVMGIATAKLNDMVTLKLAGTIPQNVNFALGNGAVLAFLHAAEIPARIEPPGPELKTEDLAEAGSRFTAQVVCER
ncbi:S1C family serine protease [Ancylobacter lacus]|uniref:S1C family serine protease n=1 Tax=Ancylobacter lacus TaxID=2579970 RepID=UPI001BCE7891|nr:serine protease [Ancylobacter lacus]MBS7540184.1 trypsin-like peptidase domain-containing protein [Ancylobacter lacus]